MHQNFHFQGIFSLRSLIDSTVGWMRERYKIQPDQDLWSERQCHLLAENRAQSPSFKTSGLSIWLLEANKDGLITFSLPIMGRPYQKQVQESPVLQTSEKLTQKFIPSINWHLFSTPVFHRDCPSIHSPQQCAPRTHLPTWFTTFWCLNIVTSHSDREADKSH